MDSFGPRQSRARLLRRAVWTVAMLVLAAALLGARCGGGSGTAEPLIAVTLNAIPDGQNDLLVVPPDRRNVRAIRVYEKAGFRKTAGVWYGSHLIYVMTREDFERRARGRAVGARPSRSQR